MSPTQKTLLVVGLALVATALLWPLVAKIGLGRLPGDIRIEREGFVFYFPVTTMVLVSLVATALFRLFGR